HARGEEREQIEIAAELREQARELHGGGVIGWIGAEALGEALDELFGLGFVEFGRDFGLGLGLGLGLGRRWGWRRDDGGARALCDERRDAAEDAGDAAIVRAEAKREAEALLCGVQ